MAYTIWIMMLAAGDQWIKHRIEKQDPEQFPKPLPKTKDKIWIHQNHNAGFPFGFMEKYEGLVCLIPLVMTSVLAGGLMEMMKKKGRWLEKFSLSLLIGGSLSNLYDRYVRGYVVDYFSFHFGPLKKVVFNLGDICIFLGSGLHVLSMPSSEKAAGNRITNKIN